MTLRYICKNGMRDYHWIEKVTINSKLDNKSKLWALSLVVHRPYKH